MCLQKFTDFFPINEEWIFQLLNNGVTPHIEPFAPIQPGPGHNLIGLPANGYVSKITVLNAIAKYSYFLRRTFDDVPQSLNLRDVSRSLCSCNS